MIRKRGRHFQVDIHHPGGRFRRNCTTKQEAKDLMDRVKSAIKSGESLDSIVNRVTLSELLQDTAEKHWKGTKAERSTMQRAEAVVSTLGPHRFVKDLQQYEIDQAVSQWESQGNSPATINRKISIISKMFAHAKRKRWVYHDILFERQKEPAGRLRWITETEEKQLIGFMEAAGFPEESMFIQVILDTGMRPSEIRRLTPQDVSEDGWVTVEDSKNGTRRRVPLTERAKGILENRLDVVGIVTPDKLRVSWDLAKRHMNLQDDKEFVPYACRHTFASRLVQKDIRLEVIQKLMGHKNIAMTVRYAHLAPSNFKDAIKLLDK